MKKLYVKTTIKIKDIFGICNAKGCCKKSTMCVYFKVIDEARCVCHKHLIELQNITSNHYN